MRIAVFFSLVFTKVVFACGYSIDGQATEILRRGCDDFIQKPFSIKRLSEKISEFLT